MQSTLLQDLKKKKKKILPYNLAFSFSIRINNICWLMAFFHNDRNSALSFVLFGNSAQEFKQYVIAGL